MSFMDTIYEQISVASYKLKMKFHFCMPCYLTSSLRGVVVEMAASMDAVAVLERVAIQVRLII